MRETLRPEQPSRYPQLCISTVVGTAQPESARWRLAVAVAWLLGSFALLLPGQVRAHAQTRPASTQDRRAGVDRLQIVAKARASFPADDAVVTATGTLGRRGDVDAATRTVDVHVGDIAVIALPRGRRCPQGPPDTGAARTVSGGVYEARYAEVLTIVNAFEISGRLRFCAFLTAPRRTPTGVRTVTVARASTIASASVIGDGSPRDDDLDLVFGGILAWLFIAALIAAIGAAIRWLLTSSKAATAGGHTAGSRPPPAGPSPRHPVTSALPTAPADSPPPVAPPMRGSSAQAQAERPRRRAKPRDVIQDAVEAIADTYRDRLQVILEHQDGPTWLDALNQRRHASMIQDGKDAPRPYDFLEPRAVLNCLAYDAAGLQLISARAATSAKQLSGLAIDAHHPKPHAPLTDADGYRAWALYADITGLAPAGDPFER